MLQYRRGGHLSPEIMLKRGLKQRNREMLQRERLEHTVTSVNTRENAAWKSGNKYVENKASGGRGSF